MRHTFYRRAAIVEEEDALPPVDLKQLLCDKDTRLASDDFWDKFNLPTQGELALKAQQEEQAQLDEEEEEDREEVLDCSCVKEGFKAELLGTEEIYAALKRILSVDWPDEIFRSSIVSDLVQRTDKDKKTLLVQIVRLLAKTDEEETMAVLYDIGLGIIRSAEFIMDEDGFSRILDNFGIDTHAIGPIKSDNSLTHYELIRNLDYCLRLLSNVNCGSKLHCMPLLFDPRLRIVCLPFIRKYISERNVDYMSLIAGLEDLIAPRLVIFLRCLPTDTSQLLNHFLSTQLGAKSLESDEDFISHVSEYVSKEISFKQLSHALDLIWLRLMRTGDIKKDQLSELKTALVRAKESVPVQPYIYNIRCLDVLAKMITFSETLLRAKGVKAGFKWR